MRIGIKKDTKRIRRKFDISIQKNEKKNKRKEKEAKRR